MDKKIIEQLYTLRNQKPDSQWKKSNRELLLSQISASAIAVDSTVETGYNFLNFSFFKGMPQPLMATFLIFAILFGGGAISIKASKHAMPGDSLYIAKKLNEKAKLAITFDEKKKTKLGLEFAGERVREIQEILKAEEDDIKEEKVIKLVDEARKEIRIAKDRINGNEQQTDQLNNNIEVAVNENSEELVEEMVFSAGLEKEDKGLQVSGLNDGSKTENVSNVEKDKIESVKNDNSTSSVESSRITNDLGTTTDKGLNNQEFLKTIDGLVLELENAIGQISDEGEVRGVSEDASSTEMVGEGK